MQTVQWDYSGKWDTRKKCKITYSEYICSVHLAFFLTKKLYIDVKYKFNPWFVKQKSKYVWPYMTNDTLELIT